MNNNSGLVTSILRFIIFTRGNAIKDGTWSCTKLMIWSIIEPNVYLISACLLAMRPLLTRFFGDDGSKKYGSSGYSSNLKPSAGSAGGFSGAKAAGNGQNLPFSNPFDCALYGDEIQLVSRAEKDSETDRSGYLHDQIHVQKDMNVSVLEDTPKSWHDRRAGP